MWRKVYSLNVTDLERYTIFVWFGLPSLQINFMTVMSFFKHINQLSTVRDFGTLNECMNSNKSKIIIIVAVVFLTAITNNHNNHQTSLMYTCKRYSFHLPQRFSVVQACWAARAEHHGTCWLSPRSASQQCASVSRWTDLCSRSGTVQH